MNVIVFGHRPFNASISYNLTTLFQDHTSERDQVYSCIVQYVLFPAFTGHSHDAVEEWAFEGKTSLVESSCNVQLVTEAWVEPQFGVFNGLNSKLDYLEGLAYYNVPDAVIIDLSLSNIFPSSYRFMGKTYLFDFKAYSAFAHVLRKLICNFSSENLLK